MGLEERCCDCEGGNCWLSKGNCSPAGDDGEKAAEVPGDERDVAGNDPVTTPAALAGRWRGNSQDQSVAQESRHCHRLTKCWLPDGNRSNSDDRADLYASQKILSVIRRYLYPSSTRSDRSVTQCLNRDTILNKDVRVEDSEDNNDSVGNFVGNFVGINFGGDFVGGNGEDEMVTAPGDGTDVTGNDLRAIGNAAQGYSEMERREAVAGLVRSEDRKPTPVEAMVRREQESLLADHHPPAVTTPDALAGNCCSKGDSDNCSSTGRGNSGGRNDDGRSNGKAAGYQDASKGNGGDRGAADSSAEGQDHAEGSTLREGKCCRRNLRIRDLMCNPTRNIYEYKTQLERLQSRTRKAERRGHGKLSDLSEDDVLIEEALLVVGTLGFSTKLLVAVFEGGSYVMVAPERSCGEDVTTVDFGPRSFIEDVVAFELVERLAKESGLSAWKPLEKYEAGQWPGLHRLDEDISSAESSSMALSDHWATTVDKNAFRRGPVAEENPFVESPRMMLYGEWSE